MCSTECSAPTLHGLWFFNTYIWSCATQPAHPHPTQPPPGPCHWCKSHSNLSHSSSPFYRTTSMVHIQMHPRTRRLLPPYNHGILMMIEQVTYLISSAWVMKQQICLHYQRSWSCIQPISWPCILWVCITNPNILCQFHQTIQTCSSQDSPTTHNFSTWWDHWKAPFHPWSHLCRPLQLFP